MGKTLSATDFSVQARTIRVSQDNDGQLLLVFHTINPNPAVGRSLPARRSRFSTLDGDVSPAVGPAAAVVFAREGTFAALG
jgi:hypothetical protein